VKRGDSFDCSKLSYLPATVEGAGLKNLTDLQTEVLKVIIYASFIFDMSDFPYLRVNSDAHRVDGIGPEQWIEELEGWETSVWAGLRLAVLDHAIGPQMRLRDLNNTIGIHMANTTAEKALCQSQRMHKASGFA
jgi:hypothetical protein